MAGVKGRSGRRQKSLAEHLRHGTYRRDRHGELPPGGPAAVLRYPLPLIDGTAALRAAQSAPIVEPPAELLLGLGSEGLRLVFDVFQQFEPGPAEVVILRTAAEAVDRIHEVRSVIKRDGLVITTSRGSRSAHPLLKVEKAAAQQLIAAMRSLGLPSPT